MGDISIDIRSPLPRGVNLQHDFSCTFIRIGSLQAGESAAEPFQTDRVERLELISGENLARDERDDHKYAYAAKLGEGKEKEVGMESGCRMPVGRVKGEASPGFAGP